MLDLFPAHSHVRTDLFLVSSWQLLTFISETGRKLSGWLRIGWQTATSSMQHRPTCDADSRLTVLQISLICWNPKVRPTVCHRTLPWARLIQRYRRVWICDDWGLHNWECQVTVLVEVTLWTLREALCFHVQDSYSEYGGGRFNRNFGKFLANYTASYAGRPKYRLSRPTYINVSSNNGILRSCGLGA
jgi:hypothetical protein